MPMLETTQKPLSLSPSFLGENSKAQGRERHTSICNSFRKHLSNIWAKHDSRTVGRGGHEISLVGENAYNLYELL